MKVLAFPYDFKENLRNRRKIDLFVTESNTDFRTNKFLQNCRMKEFKDYYPRNKKEILSEALKQK